MEQKNKMFPCPFCGDSDPFVERMELYSYAVRCNSCLATGEQSEENSVCDENEHEAEAIKNWNKRVRVDESHQQFDKLIAHLDREIEDAQRESNSSMFSTREQYYMGVDGALTDVRERLIRILHGID